MRHRSPWREDKARRLSFPGLGRGFPSGTAVVLAHSDADVLDLSEFVQAVEATGAAESAVLVSAVRALREIRLIWLIHTDPASS